MQSYTELPKQSHRQKARCLNSGLITRSTWSTPFSCSCHFCTIYVRLASARFLLHQNHKEGGVRSTNGHHCSKSKAFALKSLRHTAHFSQVVEESRAMIDRASACIASLAQGWPESIQTTEASHPDNSLLAGKTEDKHLLVHKTGTS